MSDAHRHRGAGIPDPNERAVLNAQLHAGTSESGFWDEHGRPAPWPVDIDEWTPSTSTPEPGQPPF